MKRRNVWKKEEAVSPVIATILMVAITVVLAATLYMMLPGADEGETVTAMSGSRTRTGNNWIVSINAGNVPFNNGEDFRLYDPGTGASISGVGNVGDSNETASVFTHDGNTFRIWFNDNDNNGRVNGGDTIVIYDPGRNAEGLEFRLSGTSLRVTL